jgi:hypothetical protein
VQAACFGQEDAFRPAVSNSSNGDDFLTIETQNGQTASIAVSDVNGDGKPDLLVTNDCAINDTNCFNTTVSVLLGNGDGTFQSAVSYEDSGVLGASIAVADVNGDGKPDVLLASACVNNDNCANGAVGVLLGNGDGTFQAPVSYNPAGNDGEWIAVADVNGDGKPDLVVAGRCIGSCANGVVSVLLGNGEGTFQPAVNYNSGGYDGALSVAVADVNGDGKPDLLVANECVDSSNCSNGGVGVLLGNGDGTFQAPVTYSSGGYGANSVVVADVNGDGHPDLLVANVANVSNSVVSVLLGNGDGTFQSAVSYDSGGESVNSIAVADVNGDGKPDLLVANQCASSSNGNCLDGVVSVLLGNGDGTFQAPVNYNSGGEGAVSIAVADMNGDGKPDLIVANECPVSGDCDNGGVGVLLGNGDGTFQAVQTTLANSNFSRGQIAVADFNGDGKLDVAIGSGPVLLLGNGDGTFQSPIGLGAGGTGTAVGDFNGDGRPDLAVADGAVTVLLNIFAFVQQPQTISFTTNAPASAVYNSQFTVAATASSGLPVAFASSGACTNAGATYTMTSGTGSCSVIANQAGNASYSAAPQVTQTVAAALASQTITFTQTAPASAVYNSSFTVAATGGASGNPVSIAGSGACNGSGTGSANITMTSGTGTCTVTANQAGNSNYAAGSGTETTNATPLSQAIMFITPPPATAKSGDTFTVAATGGASGNPVTFSVGAGSVCTNSGTNGATYTMTSDTGNCYVVANQAGNSNYAAATQVTETVAAVHSVVKIAPTVTFTGAPSAAAYLSTFTVATTQNSGLAPTFSSTTGSVCSVSGGVVTMKKGTGTCTVKASWATDTYYSAASLSQSTMATLLGTATSVTNTATLILTNLKKVTVYFTVTNGQNAVTGNVTVTASSGEHCTGTVTAGKCLLAFTATGSKTLTAVFAGNPNDATSTSASYPLTVN